MTKHTHFDIGMGFFIYYSKALKLPWADDTRLRRKTYLHHSFLPLFMALRTGAPSVNIMFV